MFDTLVFDTRLIPVNGVATYTYSTRDEAVAFARFARSCKKGLIISGENLDSGFRITIVNCR